MEHLQKCPLCDKVNLIEYIQCKDHLLSQNIFTIQKCQSCGFLFTNPRPDINEIKSYYKSDQYISHSNTRKGLINKIYHLVRSRNHVVKYELIRQYKNAGKILDVGCATGEFLAFMQKKGWDSQGVEPDPNARQYAQKQYNLKIIPEEKFINIPDGMFDVVTLWHVLEHVHDLDQRMKELYRVLKNDGLLIIAVPNSKSFDAGFFGTFWAGYDLPRHLYHFNKELIDLLCDKHHFQINDIIPMKYDAYYISLLSERYKTQKNNYIKAFIRGMRSNIQARKNDNNYSSLIFTLKKKMNFKL